MSKAREKIAVFSGAGISAESGLATFRDAGGLWSTVRIEDVATPEAWRRDPGRVLAFYNKRRADAASARPNAAHRAIAALQARYEVTVITQNVDDLHERAGSERVLHLHGALRFARSSADPALCYDIGADPIELGDTCEQGAQLRPHVVWFGEEILDYEPALRHIAAADRVLAVGSSLSVFPAAGLLQYAPEPAEKLVVAPELDAPPPGYTWLRGRAVALVPGIVERWLREAER